MAATPTQQSPSLAVAAGFLCAGLTALYAVVLILGLLTRPSRNHQIQDPWFTLMELLILAIAPTMVLFSIGLHAWVPRPNRSAAVCAIASLTGCATVTMAVHFSILTLARLPSFQAQEWTPLVFAFRWPSLAYALDILAWDVFFPFGAASTALALKDIPGLHLERGLLGVSAALAALGLAGVPLADMSLRNIGIVGYALVFPLAAALIAKWLQRASQASAA